MVKGRGGQSSIDTGSEPTRRYVVYPAAGHWSVTYWSHDIFAFSLRIFPFLSTRILAIWSFLFFMFSLHDWSIPVWFFPREHSLLINHIWLDWTINHCIASMAKKWNISWRVCTINGLCWHIIKIVVFFKLFYRTATITLCWFSNQRRPIIEKGIVSMEGFFLILSIHSAPCFVISLPLTMLLFSENDDTDGTNSECHLIAVFGWKICILELYLKFPICITDTVCSKGRGWGPKKSGGLLYFLGALSWTICRILWPLLCFTTYSIREAIEYGQLRESSHPSSCTLTMIVERWGCSFGEILQNDFFLITLSSGSNTQSRISLHSVFSVHPFHIEWSFHNMIEVLIRNALSIFMIFPFITL